MCIRDSLRTLALLRFLALLRTLVRGHPCVLFALLRPPVLMRDLAPLARLRCYARLVQTPGWEVRERYNNGLTESLRIRSNRSAFID